MYQYPSPTIPAKPSNKPLSNPARFHTTSPLPNARLHLIGSSASTGPITYVHKECIAYPTPFTGIPAHHYHSLSRALTTTAASFPPSRKQSALRRTLPHTFHLAFPRSPRVASGFAALIFRGPSAFFTLGRRQLLLSSFHFSLLLCYLALVRSTLECPSASPFPPFFVIRSNPYVRHQSGDPTRIAVLRSTATKDLVPSILAIRSQSNVR